MILHRYLARRFAITVLAVFMIFLALNSLIDYLDHLRKFGGSDLSMAQIAELVMLRAPAKMHQILPLVMVLASIALFLNLARSSELVVTRAAGRSAIRALVAPVATTFAIGVAAIAVMNPIIAATAKKYESRIEDHTGTQSSTLTISSKGLWLRQGNGEEQIVIHARRSNLDGTRLFEVTLLGFDAEGRALRQVSAKSARLLPGFWELRLAKEWPLIDATNPETGATEYPVYKIPSDLTKDQISDSFGVPSSIPIWDLPAFVNQLETAGFSARRHWVWFHMELALPVFLIAIVLIGAGCTLSHGRVQRTSMMVLTAILLGFGLFFLRNFAQILGENGQISAILAAWAPPVAAIGMMLGYLFHVEDG